MYPTRDCRCISPQVGHSLSQWGAYLTKVADLHQAHTGMVVLDLHQVHTGMVALEVGDQVLMVMVMAVVAVDHLIPILMEVLTSLEGARGAHCMQ